MDDRDNENDAEKLVWAFLVLAFAFPKVGLAVVVALICFMLFGSG